MEDKGENRNKQLQATPGTGGGNTESKGEGLKKSAQKTRQEPTYTHKDKTTGETRETVRKQKLAK